MSDIQKYKSLPQLAENAPKVLAENKGRVQRAENAGNALLAKYQEGMSDELDQQIADYLNACNRTLKHIKGQREPITQFLSAASKEFTTIEQAFDGKRENVYSKLQKIRDNWAKEKAERLRKEQQEKQRKLNIESELRGIGTKVEEYLTQQFAAHAFNIKDGLQTIFNDLTLEGWDDGVNLINSYQEDLTREIYGTWKPQYNPIYAERSEVEAEISRNMTKHFEAFKNKLNSEIANMKAKFANEFTGKKNELIALQEAGEKERERLEKEKAEREKAEAERLALQRQEEEKQAQEEAQRKASEAEMQDMFAKQTAEKEIPKRTGFKIEITSQKAYLELVNFWFEKEGQVLPFDALERMTLGRITKFCATYAHKFDEKIQSPYIKYVEEFKQKN